MPLRWLSFVESCWGAMLWFALWGLWVISCTCVGGKRKEIRGGLSPETSDTESCALQALFDSYCATVWGSRGVPSLLECILSLHFGDRGVPAIFVRNFWFLHLLYLIVMVVSSPLCRCFWFNQLCVFLFDWQWVGSIFGLGFYAFMNMNIDFDLG